MSRGRGVLFLDTTGKNIILGAQMGKESFYYVGTETEKKHASTLLQKIDSFLISSNIRIENISQIGVVIGPGSFTGIRIGISTANALSKSLNAAILSINSLELATFGHNKNVISIIDCLNGNYYSLIKTSENDCRYRILSENELKHYEGYDILPAKEVSPENKLRAFVEKADKGFFSKRALPFYLRESSADREERDKDHYLILNPSTQDIDRISDIEKASFRDPWSEKMLYDEIELNNPTNVIIKDIRDDTIIGYSFSRSTDDVLELLRIAVKSAYKGAGFASLMINRIVAESRNLNIKSIILEVSCINESAIRLYQKNGFIVDGRRKNYYRKDEDALLMRKLI